MLISLNLLHENKKLRFHVFCFIYYENINRILNLWDQENLFGKLQNLKKIKIMNICLLRHTCFGKQVI